MTYKPATEEEVEELTAFLNSPLPEDHRNHSAAAERVTERSFRAQGVPTETKVATEAASQVTNEDAGLVTDDEAVEEMRGKLLSSPDRYNFILAGHATFTVVNTETSNRFTYKVQTPKGKETPHFIKVLVGPSSDYAFIGTIFDKLTFKRGSRSSISESAQSVKVFTWFWKRLMDGKMPESIEVWHEGRCGACGRALTVPESIERGIGPICAMKSGM